MFDNFEAISNDPRSGTGVFRGLKRHTSYDTGDYCTYTSYDFGVPAEGEFITVTADAVGDPLGRKDLLRAGPAVRDESGRIIGCKGLAL